MTENKLILAEQTPDQLRRKFERPSPALAPLWNHFLVLARRNPFWCSSYGILAFLATGKDVFRRTARDVFLQFTATEKEALLCWEPQFHTHTVSAPLARLMVYYDWIADTDLLTADERRAFEAAVLDFAHLIPMDQLQGRVRSFDNQIFANCLGGAVTGYMLGVRRGDSALARRLYAIALDLLLDQYGRLPPSCYSGEGSTYHEQVVGPLLLLGGLFLEETQGLAVYDRGLPPAHVPLRDWYLMSVNMVGPGGLLPAWDAGGARASVKAPLVYRARRERSPEPLALIRDTDMWYPLNNAAWEMDDRLWSLVWWPDDLEIPATSARRPWMNPRAAGALQTAGARLFQYWDECGGGPYNGRPNVNPNAILLETGGLPLLLDGSPGLAPAHLRVTPEQAIEYLGRDVLLTLLKYWNQAPTDENLRKAALHGVGGSVGESNSLVIDRENWFVPRRPVAGRGTALHAAGALQVIESDSTDYYADRYDAARVARISALVDGRYVVTLDDTAFRSPHRLTWQAFTWPGARVEGDRVIGEAGGETRLSFLPGGAGQFEVTPISEFPSYPCGGSARVEFTPPRPAASQRLPMCLVPQALLTPIEDVSRGWTLEAGGCRRAEDVDLNTYYLVDEVTPGGTLTFRRDLRLDDPARVGGLTLRIERAVPNLRLTVNGRSARARYTQAPAFLQGQSLAFAHLFDIGHLLQPGRNELVVALESWHGESLLGPVTLLAAHDPAPPAFAADSPTEFTVTLNAAVDRLLLGNTALVEWQGGKTDARHALLRSDGALCLAGVTRAEFPGSGLRLTANRPVDIAVTGDRIELGELPDAARLSLTVPGGQARLSAAAVLEVAAVVTRPIELIVRSAARRQVFLNGVSAGLGGREDDIRLTPAPTTDLPETAPVSAEEVYRLGERVGGQVERQILAALGTGDWRVQMAAAEVAGRLGIVAASTPLLAILDQEEARPPHPKLTRGWARSKMRESLFAGEDHSPDRTTDPVEGAKRWRLKHAAILALGRLGDARAIPPLERILERGVDFFPALSQVPLALARLDSAGSIPLLEKNRNFFEWNTRLNVRLALDYLTGRIDRTELEKRAAPA